MRRSLVLISLALAVLVSGCGNREASHREAQTEGIYLTLGELTYQVQISRALNPNEVEDRAYLKGVTATPPAKDETWFGVFLRVDNQGEKPLTATGDLRIEDTQGHVFQPVFVDPKLNAFAYSASTIPPHGQIPPKDSAPSDGPIQGSEVLFKIPYQAYQNRPLKLKITPPGGAEEGSIDLDL